MKRNRCPKLALAGFLLLANAAAIAVPPPSASSAGPIKSHSILAPTGTYFEKNRFNNASPLLWAILQDHLGTAKKLIRGGSNPTALYRGVYPYLGIAAGLRPCDPAMLALLIAHGADPGGKIINHAFPRGDPFYVHLVPLMAAASSGSIACVSTLMRHGADPNGFNMEGVTVLGAAAISEYCSPELITLLTKGGADPDFVPDPGDLENFLTRSNLGKPSGMTGRARHGFLKSLMFNRRPPLVWATSYDHPACARALIKNGAKVDEPTPDGYTSLMGAVGEGKSTAITDLLLHAGADVHARTKKGATALFMVVGKYTLGPPCLRCATLLVKAGADVNAVDASGDSVLIDAAGAKHALPFVRLLVSAGANVNYRNPQTGTTALKAVRAAGNSKLANYLIAHGAKP